MCTVEPQTIRDRRIQLICRTRDVEGTKVAREEGKDPRVPQLQLNATLTEKTITYQFTTLEDKGTYCLLFPVPAGTNPSTRTMSKDARKDF